MSKKFFALLEKIENSKVSVFYFFYFLIFFIFLRNFLELFLKERELNSFRFNSLFGYSHWALFYISIFLSFVVFNYFFIKYKGIEKVLKIWSIAFFFIILPPVFDYYLFPGNKCTIGYLFPERIQDFLRMFFSLGGKCAKGTAGISNGLKIEGVVLIIFSFFNFKYNKLSNLKSLAGTFINYSILFSYSLLPTILYPIIKKQRILSWDIIYTKLFIIISIILIIIILISKYKNYFKIFIEEILQKSLYTRLLYGYSLLFAGFIFCAKKELLFPVKYAIITNLLLSIIALTFVSLFSKIINDIEDYEIDCITNKGRILPLKKISVATYIKIGFIFLFIAEITSIFAGLYSFIFVNIFAGAYLVYSIPPIKLKRFTILSKIVIALNSIIVVLWGFLASGNNFNKLIYFPKSLFSFMFLALTFSANIIDIKDYEGDKKTGIKTLPVILGIERSKLIISMFILASYVFSASIFIKNINFFIFAWLLGLVQIFFINRKKYNELPIFISFFIYYLAFFFYY